MTLEHRIMLQVAWRRVGGGSILPIVAALWCGLAAPASAQVATDPVPGDTIAATPEGRYGAGPIHRLFLGSQNRDLWATPVQAEVVDLSAFAGGLTPIGVGGGGQTQSLRFLSGDGRRFNFRSIDKDAGRSLDPALRRSIAARVLQDQVSALMPMATLVVSPILEAAGVLFPAPTLVVLPSDPALGEYREDFQGLLGFLEERPNEAPDGEPGFAGADRVVGSPRFFELLEESPEHRIDGEAFLNARLVDIFVGDWDRHPDQWRWAGFDGENTTRWLPIPRDRDWALSRIKGLLPWAATYAWPHWVGFGREYPNVLNSTWSGRALDRRLLSHMPRERWDAVAADLQSRITDDVIIEAVSQLPDSYYEKIGTGLRDDLMSRRDGLREVAARFYEMLAREVDIHATDADEVADITRLADGSVRVQLRDSEADAGAPPYFDRTFLPDETSEVRLYLRGGDDVAVVTGAGDGVHVRVIGGGSDDTLTDQADGGPTSFYDDRGDNEIRPGDGTRVDESDYEEPFDPEATTHQAAARDWGSSTIPLPVLEFDPDVGLFAGAGFIRWGYGFRRYPYRTRFQATIGVGTPSGELRAAVDWEFPVGPLGARLRAGMSGAEVTRFYGIGNETTAEGPTDFFKAERREFTFESLVEWRASPQVRLGVGPTVKLFRPERGDTTLLEQVDPYGHGDFDEIGVVGELLIDGRDREMVATDGGYLHLTGRYFPGSSDVTEGAFGGVRGVAGTYVSAGGYFEPTLAVRGGGEKLWGTVPYHEAAYLGGSGDLRGYRTQRFAGDRSLFANAELRVFLTEAFFLLPADLGVFGLADVGRVYVSGETSATWHRAWGGGIWASFLRPTNVVSLAIARSPEQTGVYFRAGFMF